MNDEVFVGTSLENFVSGEPNMCSTLPPRWSGVSEIADENKVEAVKILIDYSKHLTTLSTGSIVVIATFLDKFGQNTQDKALAAYSIVSFLISVLGMLVAGGVLVLRAEAGQFETTSGSAVTIERLAIFLGSLGLLVGVILLGCFGWANLE